MTLDEFRNRRYQKHSLHGLQLENVLEAHHFGTAVEIWQNISNFTAGEFAKVSAHQAFLAFPELRCED